MKNKIKKNRLQELSMSIGTFINYWGFRRIHGAIWAQMYLTRSPLSCTDLTKRLGVSKALISPALEELVKFKLLEEAASPNEKTKLYRASPDINEVIHHVLKTRESVMLKKIAKDFSSFSKSNEIDDEIDSERVQKLGEMIFAANLMLQIMQNQEDLLKFPMELDG